MGIRILWCSIATLFLAGCPGLAVGPVPPAADDFDEFKRPDNVVVRCQRVPVEVMNKSSKVNVDLTVRKIGEVAKGSAGVIIVPERMFDVSISTNDYRVVARQVCLDYGSGVYTAEEYKAIRERILPTLRQKAETGARIDSDLIKGEVITYDDRKRVALTFRVRTITTNNLEAAHVIYMLAVAHNEDILPAGHAARATTQSCKDVPSCIGYRFWDNAANPLIVRGGDVGSTITWTLDVKPALKALRVYWEVYQREADIGTQCVEDRNRKAPDGGIPFLKLVDAKGATVPGGCYMSYGDSVVKL